MKAAKKPDKPKVQAEERAATREAPAAASKPLDVWLFLVLALALGVRLVGITWGLPNALHYFSYHPDESVVLMHSASIDILHGHFLPHFYNYGSLQLILIAFACVIGTGYHFIGPLALASGGIDPVAMAHAQLTARLITVLMGVGTVWATYALGLRLWGRFVGLLGALLLAVMPLHVQHSHFATVDVPATLWTTLSLVWAVKCASEKGCLRFNLGGALPYLASGIFAGFAAATKYNCGAVILALLAAGHIRAWEEAEGGSRRQPLRAAFLTSLGVLAAAAAFLAACPGAVFDRPAFLRDVHFEAAHVYHQPEPYFQRTGPGWRFILAHNLPAEEGWLPLIASLAGIAYAAVRRERGDGILGIFAGAYFVIVALALSRWARYEIPLLPLLSLWAFRPLKDLLLRRKALATALAALVILGVLPQSFAAVYPMTRPDVRDVVAQRILAMNPPPAAIGFASTPWFWTPPLNPYFSYPAPWAWYTRFRAETRTPAVLIANPHAPSFDASALQRYQPDIVLLSDVEYEDPLRLGDVAAKSYCALLKSRYSIEVFRIADPFEKWTGYDGLPASALPPDMQYVSPVTLLCRAKR